MASPNGVFHTPLFSSERQLCGEQCCSRSVPAFYLTTRQAGPSHLGMALSSMAMWIPWAWQGFCADFLDPCDCTASLAITDHRTLTELFHEGVSEFGKSLERVRKEFGKRSEESTLIFTKYSHMSALIAHF